jgi:hypothetical protein
MTFKELQDLCLSRVGDVAYFRGAPNPTIAPLTRVKVELQAAYEYVVNLLGEHGWFEPITNEDITWAANTKEVDLSSALSAEPREVLYVGLYGSSSPGANEQPLPALATGYQQVIGIRRFHDRRLESRMYIHGDTLGFNVVPTAQQTVHVRYATFCESLSADGDIPAQAPKNLHDLIAQRAALLLTGGENGAPQYIAREFERLEYRLERWATHRRLRLGGRSAGFMGREA